MQLGVEASFTSNRDRFKNAFSSIANVDVPWERIYYQTQTAASMTRVATDAAAGWKVMFSWRPLSESSETAWNNIVGGSEDSRLTDIGNMLAGIPNAGIWCFNHEPENDPGSAYLHGASLKGDAFRAAFDHVANIIKPLAPEWRACANFMDLTWNLEDEFNQPAAWDQNPDPNRWVPDTCEILGMDYYAWRGSGDETDLWATNYNVADWSTAFAAFLSTADTFGIPMNFPEFGYAVHNPVEDASDELNRQAWFNAIGAAYASDPRIESCFYYEVGDDDISGRVNREITDPTTPPISVDTVKAFATFVTPTEVPSDFAPGIIDNNMHARLRHT